MGVKLSRLVTCMDCDKAMVNMSGGEAHISCASDEIKHRELFMLEGKICAEDCNGFNYVYTESGGKIRLADGLRYMLAGKSEFTMISLRTGGRLKYKLTKKQTKNNKDDTSEFIYYVNTFDGGEYKYAGVLFYDRVEDVFRFGKGAKGKIPSTHINIQSLLFVINKLNEGNDAINIELYHVGKCGRCGRKLTTPESLLLGLGPECSAKCGIPRLKII